MKSKTKIGKQVEKKSNRELVETILLAKKHEKWKKVAEVLSGPRRKKVEINLSEINSETKEGESVVIPGKVLSGGNLDKKIKIIAFSFSESAREKILNSKSEVIKIIDEIKKNPEAKGVKIIKK